MLTGCGGGGGGGCKLLKHNIYWKLCVIEYTNYYFSIFNIGGGG